MGAKRSGRLVLKNVGNLAVLKSTSPPLLPPSLSTLNHPYPPVIKSFHSHWDPPAPPTNLLPLLFSTTPGLKNRKYLFVLLVGLVNITLTKRKWHLQWLGKGGQTNKQNTHLFVRMSSMCLLFFWMKVKMRKFLFVCGHLVFKNFPGIFSNHVTQRMFKICLHVTSCMLVWKSCCYTKVGNKHFNLQQLFWRPNTWNQWPKLIRI